MRGLFIAVMWRTLAILCVSLLFFSSCSSDDAYTVYSRYKAHFTYDRVMTTTPLLHALNGPGEFCTIRLTAQKQLIFASLSQTQTENVAAMAAYQRFTCISGFIVGKPNTIEMGYDDMHPICFDLACPNCYHDNNIRRDLALQESGVAYCSRCKRRYNLNNLGIVEGAPAGRPLERYRITYNGSNHMVIKN